MTNFKKPDFVFNLEIGSQILSDQYVEQFHVWKIYDRDSLVTKTIDSEFCVDLKTKANWHYDTFAINLIK